MNKSKWIKRFRKFHKWPGIVIALFVILFALSGIVMNHRSVFSSIDVSRRSLPSNYKYENWNLAAVRGSIILSGNTGLMYGNIGVWKTTDDFKSFSDFNQGFPKGIDGRKINSLVKFGDNWLVAATQFGLFKRDINNGEWQKARLEIKNERIVDLAIKQDSLVILSRDYLIKTADLENFSIVQLPPPINYIRKTGLFNTFWELHSGELFGLAGKLVVDLFGAVVILLSVTGLLHFFFPKIIRRRKEKGNEVASLNQVKRKNLRWHNVVGYIFVFFLVINTFSGMHLRPPLLIAIADKQVGIIPFTHLDTPNPWQDKLRRIFWDGTLRKYIFSTSDGFYYADETLSGELVHIPLQPPVSVMGCNVFEKIGEGKFMVGSFSGMFLWDLFAGTSVDFFTGQPFVEPSGPARPIAANMVAGLITPANSAPVWFDYNRGALSFQGNHSQLPPMSQEILQKSPMSLWNVALEVHTGRIFEKYIGSLYILYVPLAGICILTVLISGFLIWWLGYRKKRSEGLKSGIT
jgi:hypothetical protein